MLPLCARSPLCVRAAPAYSAYRQSPCWHLTMKQSTLGSFFGKPAAPTATAKPLTPSNTAREATNQAKDVKSPEKKRARPAQVTLLQSKIAILMEHMGREPL